MCVCVCSSLHNGATIVITVAEESRGDTVRILFVFVSYYLCQQRHHHHNLSLPHLHRMRTVLLGGGLFAGDYCISIYISIINLGT